MPVHAGPFFQLQIVDPECGKIIQSAPQFLVTLVQAGADLMEMNLELD